MKRNELYWTPNAIRSEVDIHREKATSRIHSGNLFFKS